MLRSLFQAPAVPEITNDRLAAELDAGAPLQVVDVREPQEWQAGHIPGAVHIPLGQLPQRRGELDPAQPTVVVCRSGNRSAHATSLLRQAGFADVRNLAGGIVGWARAGRTVTR